MDIKFKVGDKAKFVTDGMTKNTVVVSKVSPVKGHPQEVTIGRFGRYRVSRHDLRHLTEDEERIEMLKDENLEGLVGYLGGYQECVRLSKVPAVSGYRIRGLDFSKEELLSKMLAHRIENNFYDVGDSVVVNGESFCDLKVLFLQDAYATLNNGDRYEYGTFRHATAVDFYEYHSDKDWDW